MFNLCKREVLKVALFSIIISGKISIKSFIHIIPAFKGQDNF